MNKINNTLKKELILAQIFFIFIAPVFFIYFKILPANWTFPILLVCSLLIYGTVRHEKISNTELGLHLDNFRKSLPYYFVFTILGIWALFMIAGQFNIIKNDSMNFLIRTFLLFIPISFFQEFIFRSFLIHKLKSIFSHNSIIILINALLFTFIHIIYPNLVISLPISFISGICFAWLYVKYPNLFLITISHAILNLTAVLLGFFNIMR